MACTGNGNNGTPDASVAKGSINPLVLTSLSTMIPIGGNLTAVKVLSPSIGFTAPGVTATHDYADSGLIGCTGDHYNTPSDLPTPSADGGVVTITGYTGGNFATQTPAPSTISCSLNSSTFSYDCIYGQAGGGGPSTTSAPFLASATPLATNDVVTFRVSNAVGNFGTFAVTATAANGLSTSATSVTYNPAADTTVALSCPDTCSGLVVANIDVTRSAGAQTTFGHITCVGALAAVNPAVIVKKEAIRAMLGCTTAGTNCDTALNQVRTVIVRFSVPGSGIDSKGNPIGNVGAGQGVLIVNPLNPA